MKAQFMKFTLTTLPIQLVLLAHFSASFGAPMEDLTLRDEKRGLDIEYRVHYSETGDKLPLILFSHGFGADRSAFTPIAQHWADQGYVVVCPSHRDGFGKSKDKGAALPKGGIAALMENAVEKIDDRVGDLTFVLDSLNQLTVKVPALNGRIDASHIGVGGHSLGAYTASLLGGVTADIGSEKARSFRDSRVQCILPISAQGTGQQGLTESSWSALTIPMLTMTGSRDRGAGGQGPEWKKEPFKFCPAGDKYLVLIEGANHVGFGGAQPGIIFDAVKTSTLAFWNAYLKDDATSKTALTTGAIFDALRPTAIIESK
jgi:predicted dienelactone hydrolase